MKEIIANVLYTYKVKYRDEWIHKAVLDTEVPTIAIYPNGEKKEVLTKEIIGVDVYWDYLKKGDKVRIELRKEEDKIIKRCYKM